MGKAGKCRNGPGEGQSSSARSCQVWGGLELNPDAPPYVCWAVGAPCSSFSGLLEGVRAVVSAGREAELWFAAWLGTGRGCRAGCVEQALGLAPSHLRASVSLPGKAAAGCTSSASEWLGRALCSRAARRAASVLSPCAWLGAMLPGRCRAGVLAQGFAELSQGLAVQGRKEYAEVFKLLGLIFPSWATETWEGRGALRAGAQPRCATTSPFRQS